MHPCDERACELNRDLGDAPGTGCEAWDTAGFDLAAILQAELPSSCPFLREEIGPLVRRVVARGGLRNLTDEELLGEVVLRALEATARGTRQLPRKSRELNRFVGQAYADHARALLGRLRCSGCLHYRKRQGRAGGTCTLARASDGSPHPHHGRGLDAHTDPRTLRCDEFLDKRRTAPLSPFMAAPVRREDEEVMDLREALARLVREDRIAGLLVMGSRLDGKDPVRLSRETGLTPDQVRYRIEKGLARLREILEDPREVGHGG